MPMPEDAASTIDDARARWRRLVHDALPAAAGLHPEWPIRLDHCFARVILDAVHGRPWREAIAAPAWRHVTPQRLHDAIALGLAIVAGTADLHALNARSLVMRGKAKGRVSERTPARRAPLNVPK